MKASHLFDNGPVAYIKTTNVPKTQTALKSYANHAGVKIMVKRAHVIDEDGRKELVCRAELIGEIPKRKTKEKERYKVGERSFKSLFDVAEGFGVSFSTFKRKAIKIPGGFSYTGLFVEKLY